MKYKVSDKPGMKFAFAPTDNLPAKVESKPATKKEPEKPSRRGFLTGAASRVAANPEAAKKLAKHHLGRVLNSMEDHFDLRPDDVHDLAHMAVKHDHKGLKDWADRNEYGNKYQVFRDQHPAWGEGEGLTHSPERRKGIVGKIKEDFVKQHPNLNHKMYGGDM